MQKKHISAVLAAVFQQYHDKFDHLKYGTIEITIRAGKLEVVKIHETFKVEDDGTMR